MPIDVNKASVADLQKKLEISRESAEAIVERREREPLREVSDLAEIPGIGPKTLDRVKGQIVFVAAEEQPEGRSESPVKAKVGVNEKGDVTVSGEVDIIELLKLLVKLLSESSPDKEEAYKTLVEIWENWAELVEKLLDEAREKGFDDEDVEELEETLEEIREDLEDLKEKIDEGDDVEDDLEDLQEKVEELLEQLEE